VQVLVDHLQVNFISILWRHEYTNICCIAFWLSLGKERLGVEFEVDIYDKENYIGGSKTSFSLRLSHFLYFSLSGLGSTVAHPYDDPSLYQELGGSIFVDVNKNLMRASQEFNLTLRNLADEDSDFGVWDGTQFLLTVRRYQ
jgi:prenylcysteine oxidase / farnesylcysteine lyase